MIEYLTTSILGSNADALVCPVNTVGVMGKGLAKAFAQRFPDLANDYAIQCARGRLRIGQIYFWTILTDKPIIETNAPSVTASSKSRRVVCLPTKMHWRNPARLEYVERGLQLFVQHYAAFDLASAAFPQLGCGLGGLAWETQVRPLMEHYLNPLPIPVTIHLRPAPPQCGEQSLP